jgi:hypothetical protein
MRPLSVMVPPPIVVPLSVRVWPLAIISVAAVLVKASRLMLLEQIGTT